MYLEEVCTLGAAKLRSLAVLRCVLLQMSVRLLLGVNTEVYGQGFTDETTPDTTPLDRL